MIFTELIYERISAPVITYAGNYKDAIQILSSGKELFDVVLLDLHLPDKSGAQLVEEMLKVCRICPIIILTGYADINFSINTITLGILDYLLKDDLDADALYKSIIYTIERRKNIIALAASEKRYSDLFRLSPQPMWVYDKDTFRFLQVNDAAIKHYGYSEEEFLSMSILDIRPEEDVDRTKTMADLHNNDKAGAYKGKFTHYTNSGDSIEVDIYSTPIEINNKKCKSVIAIDITEKIMQESKITKAIIKTQEDERYEIGSELHDNVCQILATSLMSLGMIKSTLPEDKKVFFDQCKEYIYMALNEIRNLSHRLAPAFFDDTTLEEAFSKLLHSFNPDEKYKTVIYFDKELKEHPVSQELQLNLYRILQEQLRNISKYAKADLINIGVTLSDNRLCLRISDNGAGFDPASVKSGIGLANIRRRAELFSGKLEITSSPGNGCEIMVVIPLAPQAAIL